MTPPPSPPPVFLIFWKKYLKHLRMTWLGLVYSSHLFSSLMEIFAICWKPIQKAPSLFDILKGSSRWTKPLQTVLHTTKPLINQLGTTGMCPHWFGFILFNVLRPLSAHLLLAKQGRWGWLIDEDEVGLKEKPEETIHQKDYNKIRPEAVWMRAQDLIPNFTIIGNCRCGNRQGRHSHEGPGRGWNRYPGAPSTTRLLYEDPVQGLGSFITDHPPGPPSHDMQGEGCLLLPRSSIGTLLLDLRPEAGYTFAPFGSYVHKEANHTECELDIFWLWVTHPIHVTTEWVWFYWMFYDHFSARSLSPPSEDKDDL